MDADAVVGVLGSMEPHPTTGSLGGYSHYTCELSPLLAAHAVSVRDGTGKVSQESLEPLGKETQATHSSPALS